LESIPTIRKENGDKMIEIRKIQEASFGEITSPMEKNEVNMYRLQVRKFMEQEFENFKHKASTKNFKALQIAMSWHQYWMNKAIYDEVEE